MNVGKVKMFCVFSPGRLSQQPGKGVRASIPYGTSFPSLTGDLTKESWRGPGRQVVTVPFLAAWQVAGGLVT